MISFAAYLSHPGGLTGAPRRLLTLCSALKSNDIDPCVVAPPESDLVKAAVRRGINTSVLVTAPSLSHRKGAVFNGGIVFKVRALFGLIAQNVTMCQMIIKKKWHVIWLRGSKGIAVAGLAVRLSRRPLVWDVDYELPSRGLVRVLHLVGLALSTVVVFQYKSAPEKIFGDALARRYRPKFHSIVPGVDIEHLRTYYDIRQELKDVSETFVILQVGTICDRKNQRLMLQALGNLLSRNLSTRIEYWLAFDEIQDEQFEFRSAAFRSDGVVKLLGWRDDAKTLMTKADLLVMPSKDEGVPNAVQEAMAIGLPVMASSAGGLAEIIQTGVTGWILPDNDPAAWADQITQCLKDLEVLRAVGDAGAEYAWSNFVTEVWAREYADVLKLAVSSSGSGLL